jgi:steroid delta-isomerase-like uncharacterized protein
MYSLKQSLWIFLLFFFCVSAAAQTQTKDTTARYLLFKHINAWSMHDAEAIDDVFNENAVYEDVAYGTKNHGQEEIKNFFNETFKDIPDFKVTLISWFACGNRLSCEWVMAGTLIGDSTDVSAEGKSFSVRGASVAIIKDGKFELWRDYYDK